MPSCHLCKKEAPLQDSHIIPKFAFRWLKSTGGTDFLRFGGNPNKRVQDGIRHKLLCAHCEQFFSRLEKKFSERVFAEYIKGSFPAGTYDEWYSKFVASLVWRVAASQELRGIYKDLDRDFMARLNIARSNWQEFLVGTKSNPGLNELHVVHIGGLCDIKSRKIPHNWNRFTRRQIEIDLIESDTGKFAAIYCKIGPVAFFGFINNEGQAWKGSRLAVNHGEFFKKKLIWPPYLFDFFIDRANHTERSMKSISARQLEITNQEVLKNIDRFAQSDQFSAMRADAERFGLDAVIQKKV